MRKITSLLFLVIVVMNAFISVAFGEIVNTDDNVLYVNTKEISHEMESYAQDIFKKLMKPIIREPELYGFQKNEVEKFKLGKAFNIYRYKNNIIESTDIFYIPILYNTNIRAFLAVTYDTESKNYVATLSKSFANRFQKIKSKKQRKIHL